MLITRLHKSILEIIGITVKVSDMTKCEEDKLNEGVDAPASTAAEAPPAR